MSVSRLSIRKTLNPRRRKNRSFLAAASRRFRPHFFIESISTHQLPAGKKKSTTYGPIGNWKINGKPNGVTISKNLCSWGQGFFRKCNATVSARAAEIFGFLFGLWRFMRALASGRLVPKSGWAAPYLAAICTAAKWLRVFMPWERQQFCMLCRDTPQISDKVFNDFPAAKCSSRIMRFRLLPKKFSIRSRGFMGFAIISRGGLWQG